MCGGWVSTLGVCSGCPPWVSTLGLWTGSLTRPTQGSKYHVWWLGVNSGSPGSLDKHLELPNSRITYECGGWVSSLGVYSECLLWVSTLGLYSGCLLCVSELAA